MSTQTQNSLLLRNQKIFDDLAVLADCVSTFNQGGYQTTLSSNGVCKGACLDWIRRALSAGKLTYAYSHDSVKGQKRLGVMAQTHAVVNAEVRKKTDLFGKAAKAALLARGSARAAWPRRPATQMQQVAEYGNVRWYAVLAKTAVCVAALLCTARSLIAHNHVVGTVVDSRSGKLIAGAAVELAGTDFETLTNTDGSFTFSDLPKGRYKAATSKTGYLSLFPNADWNRFTVGDAGEIRLYLTLTQAAAITGSVLDGAGQPVRSARVMLFTREVDGGVGHLAAADTFSKVDDQGTYRLYNLPPGHYLVGATPDGNSGSALFQPVYTDLISLHAGETRTSVNLTVFTARSHTVRGKVTGRQCDAIAVSLFFEGKFERSLQTNIANDCTFQFQGVPDGEYEITAAFPTTGRTAFGPLLGENPLYGRGRVEVSGSDAEGVEIALQPGVSLEGQLTFEHESVPRSACWENATVRLRALDATPFNRPLTGHVNARGGFNFLSLPPARYRANVDGLKPGCFQRDFPVVTADGANLLNVVLSTRASAVEGNVRKGAKPDSGSLIVLVPTDTAGNVDPQQARFAVADDKGAYTIEDLAPGQYRALALRGYSIELLADISFWEQHRDQTRAIALEPSAHVQLDLALQEIKDAE